MTELSREACCIAADEIESLRQQLADTQRLLAESQAREKEAIRKMHECADAHVRFIQIDHPQALDAAIAKAKREVLLEAFQAGYGRGHNDTVEGCFSFSCECEPDCATEWLADEVEAIDRRTKVPNP